MRISNEWNAIQFKGIVVHVEIIQLRHIDAGRNKSSLHCFNMQIDNNAQFTCLSDRSAHILFKFS